jgi:Ca2+-binding EF-hand superfamily protein
MNNFLLNEAMYKGLFKMLDADGSGKIDKNDLSKGMMGKLPKSQLDMIIKYLDKSGDGKIDYNEFKAAIKKVDGKKK